MAELGGRDRQVEQAFAVVPREGGRLILPLTEAGFPQGDVRCGAVFRIERRRADYPARRISSVAIFPRIGGRDADGAAALEAAFTHGGAEQVTVLYRHNKVPDADCRLRGEGGAWCIVEPSCGAWL